MADYERRHNGARGGGGGRKRRFRGSSCFVAGQRFSIVFAIVYGLRLLTFYSPEDDDYDRRQRRRYEEPLVAKIRRQLLTIAESVRSRVSRALLAYMTLFCMANAHVVGSPTSGRRCSKHRQKRDGEL